MIDSMSVNILPLFLNKIYSSVLWPRQQSHSMLPYTTHGLDTHTHGHGCPIRFFPDSSQASLGVFAAMRHTTTLYSYVCMY